MSINKKAFLYGFVAVLLIAAAVFIYIFRRQFARIASPFIMAVIISYVVSPFAKKLEEKGISRGIGIIIIYLVLLFIIFGWVIFIIPQIIENTRDLIETLPDIVARIQGFFDKVISNIKASKFSDDMKLNILNQINTSSRNIQEFISQTLNSSIQTISKMFDFIFDFTLALVIAYYFIKDSDFFSKIFYYIVPRKLKKFFMLLGSDINNILHNFIKGQLLTALIVAILQTGILIAAKTKYPVVLGLFSGLCNTIPYFGPIIGTIPSAAVALIDSPLKALWVVAGFTIVQQIDNSFISPKIIEGRLGIHPVTTIIAVLAGTQFFGVAGIFFAVPAAAIIKVAFKRIWHEIA